MTDLPTGPLPAEYAKEIEWDRLPQFIRDGVLSQEPKARQAILENWQPGDVSVTPFDGDGFLTAFVMGVPVVRIHWSRFMPGATKATW